MTIRMTLAVAAAAPPATGASPATAGGRAAKGKAAFHHCAACHNADGRGRSGIGPNLWGVVGHKSGTLSGYAYSLAMSAAAGVWTDAALDDYATAPMKAVPGNKMPTRASRPRRTAPTTSPTFAH
jgi:cytochrome c